MLTQKIFEAAACLLSGARQRKRPWVKAQHDTRLAGVAQPGLPAQVVRQTCLPINTRTVIAWCRSSLVARSARGTW